MKKLTGWKFKKAPAVMAMTMAQNRHRKSSSSALILSRILPSLYRPRPPAFSPYNRPSQPDSPIHSLPAEILSIILQFLVSSERGVSRGLPSQGRVCLLWYEIISKIWLKNFSCVHSRGTQLLEDYLSTHWKSVPLSRQMEGRNGWIRSLTINGLQTWRDIVRILKMLKSSNGGKLHKLEMEVPAMLADDYGLDINEEASQIAWPTLFMYDLTCLKIEIIRWTKDHRDSISDELLADHIVRWMCTCLPSLRNLQLGGGWESDSFRLPPSENTYFRQFPPLRLLSFHGWIGGSNNFQSLFSPDSQNLESLSLSAGPEDASTVDFLINTFSHSLTQLRIVYCRQESLRFLNQLLSGLHNLRRFDYIGFGDLEHWTERKPKDGPISKSLQLLCLYPLGRRPAFITSLASVPFNRIFPNLETIRIARQRSDPIGLDQKEIAQEMDLKRSLMKRDKLTLEIVTDIRDVLNVDW